MNDHGHHPHHHQPHHRPQDPIHPKPREQKQLDRGFALTALIVLAVIVGGLIYYANFRDKVKITETNPPLVTPENQAPKAVPQPTS